MKSSMTVSTKYFQPKSKPFCEILAISVIPSERLFSSTGNLFTKKRNRRGKNSIHNILFLKEYSKLFE